MLQKMCDTLKDKVYNIKLTFMGRISQFLSVFVIILKNFSLSLKLFMRKILFKDRISFFVSMLKERMDLKNKNFNIELCLLNLQDI